MGIDTIPSRALSLALIGAALTMAAGGCDLWPQEPRQPVLMDVVFRTPNPSDQAVMLSFEVGGAFTPRSGFHAFRASEAPSDGASTILVVATAPMVAGETRIGTLEVRSTTDAGASVARVVEVARADYVLRESLEGYGVRLLPPEGN